MDVFVDGRQIGKQFVEISKYVSNVLSSDFGRHGCDTSRLVLINPMSCNWNGSRKTRFTRVPSSASMETRLRTVSSPAKRRCTVNSGRVRSAMQHLLVPAMILTASVTALAQSDAK